MFYLNSTLNFGIPPVLVFQWEVYYKVDRLVTGPTAQQKGTTARWYSNKTSLSNINPNGVGGAHCARTFFTCKLLYKCTVFWDRLFFLQIYFCVKGKIVNRNVLFEYHRAVVPFCWAVRPFRSLSPYSDFLLEHQYWRYSKFKVEFK